MGNSRSKPFIEIRRRKSRKSKRMDADSDNDAIMFAEDDNATDSNSKKNKNDSNNNDNDNDSIMFAEDDNDTSDKKKSGKNDNDDDSKLNINNNNNNDNDHSNASAQYKFVWQWPENDGTWHDYDATTQLLLDQLTIGHKINISAGKFTYSITKTSPNACSQTNTQTLNVRTCRKAKIPLSPPKTQPIQQQGNSNWIGSGRYVFIWQFLENDGTWIDLDFSMASKLEQLNVSGTVQYSFGQFSYTVTKISKDECTQTNESTHNQRDLRRILYDTKRQKRIVWQFQDNKMKNGWCCVDDNTLNDQINKLQNGDTVNYTRGKWTYCITKVNQNSASQKNIQTNTVRAYRLYLKDKQESDANWKSKAQTNNQNNVAAYNPYQNAPPSYTGPPLGSIYASLYSRYAPTKETEKEKVILDPNDVQNIVMNDNKNGKDKDKNKNDDSKCEDVEMSEDDKQILKEFEKTLTRRSVKVLSIQKIKDNASKIMIYNALLGAKKEELKKKNVKNVERVLFHGTSFSNIAKIVNNGFNRDFNRHHLYGKGTYFSSLAAESAKYCEPEEDKCVMLVCKVIIGEYTLGTQQMDGSSIPYKPDKKTQFESCVNNMKKPTIFVINRDYHAIPTHIITFKYIK